MKIVITFFFLICCTVTFPSLGQYYATDFGQNRIQYKNFDWVYYSTNHFDVFYYAEGGKYAKEAIDFLEDEFKRLTDVLGYAPYSKTKIIIYNSVTDLQQSNIGIDDAVFTIGGEMSFSKLQIEMAHPGVAHQFKEQLVYKLSKVLINDMLFGGNFREVIQSSYLLKLPDWFIEGAARYLAFGWDVTMDDFMRDYLTSKRAKKAEKKIEGEQAGLLGQAIWNYIAIQYGNSNISNILNLTRIMHKEDVSISNALGVGYKQFSGNWRAFYLKGGKEISEGYVSIDDQKMIAKMKNEAVHLNNVAVSESGRYIAYSENTQGKVILYLYDNTTGTQKRIMMNGYKVDEDQVDREMPLIDFAGDDFLGVIYFQRGSLYLVTINIETGVRSEKPLTRFNQINSFSLNQNGRLAIISGDLDGKTDLFLVSVLRNSLRRITSDIFDDIDPTFVPGTAAIVFSSNRTSDSLSIANTSIKNLSADFNLFMFDLDTSETKFLRITHTNTRDTKPMVKNEYEMFFLSDQRGINNVFKYSFKSGTQTQVTNFNSSVKNFDLHFNENGMVFIALNGGIDEIFYYRNIDLESPKFAPQTPRKNYNQAKFMAKVLNLREIERLKNDAAAQKNNIETEVISSKNEPYTEGQKDSLDQTKIVIDPEDFVFNERVTSDQGDQIDTENYKFGINQGKKKSNSALQIDSFFNNYARLENENQIYGPIQYNPKFSSNNLIFSPGIDALRGFGFLVETQISDMLGNHVLTAGGFVSSSLKQGDLFAEYKYLKYWLDFKVKLIRKSLYFENDEEDFLRQSYKLNGVVIGAALPLTNRFRIELDPFVQQTNFRNLQYQTVNANTTVPFAEDEQVLFTGFKARGVYDNILERSFNVLQGTRALIEFGYNQSFSQEKSFNLFRIDVRHYQKIHNELTFATRLYFGKSFGQHPQKFLLGGVPNWFLAQTETHSVSDPLNVNNETNNTNLLFTEFVTNMRGYNYNEKFGTATVLLNMELRWPVFQYFSRYSIKSSFLRNFMLIAFGDIGSVWDGKAPFTRENSTKFVQYAEAPFTASIANYESPWLSSYGLGMRMALLGYYLKLDYAVPVQDFTRQSSRFTVSIGLDF
jgi:hypothetical protein